MKYRKKDYGLFIFFQIIMCTILLASCVFIHVKKQEQTTTVGTFGNTEKHENITFSDLAEVLERVVGIE